MFLRTLLITCIALAWFAAAAHAQGVAPRPALSAERAPARLDSAPSPVGALFELDPLATFSPGSGFVARAGVVLPATRLSILAEVFSQGLDPLGRLLFLENGGDLDARLTLGVDLTVRYHFAASQRGFFVGLSVGGERFRIEDPAGGTRELFDAFVAPRTGFHWFPFEDHFYLGVEAVVVVFVAKSRPQRVQGETVGLRPVVPYPSLTIGVRFR